MTKVKTCQDKSTKAKLQKVIFTPQMSTPILIAGSEKTILHFTTLSVKIHFKIILELSLTKKGKQIVRARSTHLFLS